MTKVLMEKYYAAFNGKQDARIKSLDELADVCSALHYVWPATEPWMLCACEGNSTDHMCDCKGFKGSQDGLDNEIAKVHAEYAAHMQRFDHPRAERLPREHEHIEHATGPAAYALLQQARADFTLSFRSLAGALRGDDAPLMLRFENPSNRLIEIIESVG